MEKVVVVVIFLGILVSLFSALFYMVKDKGEGGRTVWALSVRIGLSVGLFILLLVLWRLGVIAPHGVQP